VFEKVSANINVAAAYETFLNPSMRYIAANEGLRKEEIANIAQQKLNWNDVDAEIFANNLSCSENNDEGYLLPGAYVVDGSTSPKDMKLEMKNRADTAISQAIKDSGANSNSIDVETVLKVASLIQREAAGKRDMNLISGIIWNRLANNMPLQVDATLQYVKGKDGKWWPFVWPKDKYLDSPYNTYQNKGLPPTPIANPGVAAIAAALNPEKTDCVFYLHDKYGRIHCSKTYDEHKKNIQKYL